MTEEHGQIGVRVVGLDRNDAVHVRMAARLVHEEAAKVVEVLARVAPLVEDGGPGDVRIPRRHDAHRLAAGVHLAGADFRNLSSLLYIM